MASRGKLPAREARQQLYDKYSRDAGINRDMADFASDFYQRKDDVNRFRAKQAQSQKYADTARRMIYGSGGDSKKTPYFSPD